MAHDPERRDLDSRNNLVATVNGIRDDMNELKTALLGVPEDEYSGFIPRTNARLKDHGSRIGSLEKWRWLILGGAVVLGYIADKAWALVAK